MSQHSWDTPSTTRPPPYVARHARPVSSRRHGRQLRRAYIVGLVVAIMILVAMTVSSIETGTHGWGYFVNRGPGVGATPN